MAINHIATPLPNGVASGQKVINWVSAQDQAQQLGVALINQLNEYTAGGTDMTKLAAIWGLTAADCQTVYNTVNAWKSTAYVTSLLNQLNDIKD